MVSLINPSQYARNMSLTDRQMHQEGDYRFPYHYLDIAVDSYKYFFRIEYLSYMNLVKDLIKPYNGQRVLDVGCGDGRFCYELKNENLKITGIDFSEKAIGFAKSFSPEVEFLAQDIENLKLKQKFDYMVMIETLEHFIPEKIPVILENLSNVLKENGKLIITVPSKNLPLQKKHYQHFTNESLANTLSQHFEIEKMIGYSKLGAKKKIFTGLRRVGIAIYPLRERIQSIKGYYNFLSNYYKKNLETGKPEECLGIIAVCKKKAKTAS